MNKVKYSIIIGTYDHFSDCTKPCLDSIIEYTDLNNCEVIIVDNGSSTEETAEYVKKLGLPFKLLSYPNPLGYARANNEGIKIATGDYIVLLNNDCVLLKQPKNQWLDMLEKPFIENDKMGVTGPGLLINTTLKVPFIVFYCAMISKELIDKLQLNEDYEVGGAEDTEFCIEAVKLGYELCQVPNSVVKPHDTNEKLIVGGFPIYHAAEKTVGELKNWKETFKKNDTKLIKKYCPDQYKQLLHNDYERAVIDNKEDLSGYKRETARYSFAASLIPEGSKVLEIGCSSGYGLRFFPKNIQYTGIDYDEAIINYARENFAGPNRKFICADINTFEFKEHYDVIVAYEIIEHLDNGKEIAQKLKNHCNKLIISTPFKENIGLWGVHHKLHKLSERDFPSFEYKFISEDGRLIDKPEMFNGMNLMLMVWEKDKKYEDPKPTVLAFIPTKNRYDSLAMTLQSIAMQTYKPDKVLIYDDGEQKDLREIPIYKYIFNVFDEKGIKWEVAFGQKRGQHFGHQLANISDFDLVWRCFIGKTKVETTGGLKNIEDIKVGDFVKTHKDRYRAVKQVYKTKYKQHKPLLWVSTSNSTIKCTPEHPFLVYSNREFKWIKANTLEKGDKLVYPYKNTNVKDIVFFDCAARGRKNRPTYLNEYYGNMEIDADLARFFGLYLAEGCGGHDSIRFTFNNNEKDYIEFVQKVCEEKFNRTPTIHIRWATTIKLNIRSFGVRFTEWFGKDATTKRVPSFVFNWNLLNKLHFIKGYLDGDGWSNSGMSVFGSASKDLIKDMVRLANSCGIDCAPISEINPTTTSYKGVVIKNNGSYQSRISTQGTNKIKDLLYAEKIDNALLIPIKNIIQKKMSGKYKIMPSGYEEANSFVYNLEVEEDNSYIVGPAAVHNCDDDEVAEPDVLEKLISHMAPEVGAVGGSVYLPNPAPIPAVLTNKIEDIYHMPNLQWAPGTEVVEVSHLYSSFLYRTKIANYNLNLSPAAHREETLFSMELKEKGYKLLVDRSAKTYHFRSETGGIREGSQEFYFDNDNKIFTEKMEKLGIKLITLAGGYGDHLMFLHVLPLLKKKFNKLIIGCCYPEVFKDDPQITIIPVAASRQWCKDDVYVWAAQHNWTTSLVDAYKGMYNL
jgi:GT2 family glycosyltransferase/intein/homing endonuclease/2-polyprenyl-3-methyl-5-hydroxy-6-metoxy-1,4-benzoquinol methylase